ncbi:MAG: 2-C-methyl-D-erythritol 2,4-cyclodiphosphate synthase [Desulfarculus sp.]|nr:2-C-methyl-D-erythritol 2,4-cyclodiphosphate synthase [Desulfarculus sp.]
MEDLALAESLLGPRETRSGQGLDVHRLVAGRPLVLGGVKIDFELGLLGHSDADVLTHAVMDALLAAAGLGDIGRHFPDRDPAFKDADSLILLGRVRRMLAQEGWRPVSVSVTLMAQRPKIAHHAPAMAANLARVLGIAPQAVNVAATTSEGLGFTGRGEGMAALALASIVNDIHPPTQAG